MPKLCDFCVKAKHFSLCHLYNTNAHVSLYYHKYNVHYRLLSHRSVTIWLMKICLWVMDKFFPPHTHTNKMLFVTHFPSNRTFSIQVYSNLTTIWYKEHTWHKSISGYPSGEVKMCIKAAAYSLYPSGTDHQPVDRKDSKQNSSSSLHSWSVCELIHDAPYSLQSVHIAFRNKSDSGIIYRLWESVTNLTWLNIIK